MIGMKKKQQQRNQNLDLFVDRLENRLLLAADVSVKGSNVTVKGDAGSDGVFVYESTGTVWVDVYEGDTLVDAVDTGLTSINKLKIVTKGGADEVSIDNDVVVTGKSTIKLGSGQNELDFGGLHNRVKIVGGSDVDDIVLNGGIGTSKNVIKTKGGNDVVAVDIAGYIDAATNGPLGDALLAGLDGVDGLEDLEGVANSLLAALPSINAKLGGGNDIVELTVDGDSISDGDILDLIDSLGFEFDSVEEAVTAIEALASDAGIGIPQFIKANGGGGSDTLNPAGLQSIINLIGSARKFEVFGSETIELV